MKPFQANQNTQNFQAENQPRAAYIGSAALHLMSATDKNLLLNQIPEMQHKYFFPNSQDSSQ